MIRLDSGSRLIDWIRCLEQDDYDYYIEIVKDIDGNFSNGILDQLIYCFCEDNNFKCNEYPQAIYDSIAKCINWDHKGYVLFNFVMYIAYLADCNGLTFEDAVEANLHRMDKITACCEVIKYNLIDMEGLKAS